VRLLRAAPVGEAPPRFVLLGFKPQGLPAAAETVAPFVGKDTILLSILAGVDLATLRARFPQAAAIVRVMPNLAAALGKSPIALVADGDSDVREEVEALMAPLGTAEWLSGEDQMDLVTALAGSGPAFVYRVIDTLAAGAAALGLRAIRPTVWRWPWSRAPRRWRRLRLMGRASWRAGWPVRAGLPRSASTCSMPMTALRA
jgi:pyrroline-5-carboxylate reductase